MYVVSLFAGIGGFDLAARSLGISVVYANEYDTKVADVYEYHFGSVDRRDICDVPSGEIPDCDLVVGGPPCQSFSLAGNSRGLDDPRGELMFEFFRVVADKRPRYFLLENVKRLLGHNKGESWQAILEICANIGYECQWQVLDSQEFGVPQHRERVFLVGHIGGTTRPKVFPLSRKAETYSRKQLLTEAPIVRTLSGGAHSGGDHSGMTMILDKQGNVRRLTPVETERLMGFPDGWTERGVNGPVKMTQRFKMTGNAVVVPVAQAVLEKLWQCT